MSTTEVHCSEYLEICVDIRQRTVFLAFLWWDHPLGLQHLSEICAPVAPYLHLPWLCMIVFNDSEGSQRVLGARPSLSCLWHHKVSETLQINSLCIPSSITHLTLSLKGKQFETQLSKLHHFDSDISRWPWRGERMCKPIEGMMNGTKMIKALGELDEKYKNSEQLRGTGFLWSSLVITMVLHYTGLSFTMTCSAHNCSFFPLEIFVSWCEPN